MSNMFKFSAVGVVFSTSHLKMGDLECEGEVGGDGEGDLLSEWAMDLDFITFTVHALLLVPKMLMPLKSLHQHQGKPPCPDLKGNSFSVWCDSSDSG